ncbi:DUF6544 family protein [Adhaeribacter soli]|uniref:DUF6544 family protein n=1 Tax=Adhaeribacter soli TaxID=2607655 RepID=UPI002938D173|nr:DUF6544 family protein [Adhaeribacter soli]
MRGCRSRCNAISWHVLKEGQSYLSYARLQHTGFFKTDLEKDWIAIAGEQYFTSRNPGFIWQGKTSMFTAIDKFVNGSGNLNVKLFSVYKMVDAKGEKYDQGELLRWLGESAWFPTNLLPTENLRWEAVDDQTANLHYQYQNLHLQYKVRFNAAGELVSCETRRYMGDKSLESWIGRFSNYQEINGMLLPTRVEGAWILKGEEKPYARFEVTCLEHDIPEAFRS